MYIVLIMYDISTQKKSQTIVKQKKLFFIHKSQKKNIQGLKKKREEDKEKKNHMQKVPSRSFLNFCHVFRILISKSRKFYSTTYVILF